MIDLSRLKKRINQHPRLKACIHRMMFCNARPRLWVKWLLNPLLMHHGRGAVIRRHTIMNVSPINRFYLGNHSTIEEFTVVDNGVGNVMIGNHSRIGLRCTLIGPVEVGNHVILAQNVVLSGLNHCYEDLSRPIHQQGVETRPISIGDESWIGANTIITAGVHIGRHVVIGAGSVVTHNIPDFCMAAGNPARIIKRIQRNNP